jgi:CspA family cold shock protein
MASNIGVIVGQCKWFSDKLGYGFVTVQSGEDKGKDIFVHHSGICPLNSTYKTLRKGEYINFNIVTGANGFQAVDVTGVGGGSLMCDVQPLHPTASAVNTGCVARSEEEKKKRARLD